MPSFGSGIPESQRPFVSSEISPMVECTTSSIQKKTDYPASGREFTIIEWNTATIQNKIVNPVIGWESMIEESNTCEEIFCVFKKLNMGDIADSLKEINDTIEDDPDEDPIVLDSLKKMSCFVIKYKPQNFIIGVASTGFIRLEWRLPLNGILAIEFLTSSLIRYAAIYPQEKPDIEQQRSNGSLEEKNILPIIRQLISLEFYNE